MTIPEIKSQLSITAVLASYGLEAGKGNSMKCPFHADTKASMKIYPDTNTAYCFAGSCEVESVDVIDFILHMEKCDKRTAILKAKELCGQAISMPDQKPEVKATSPALNAATVYQTSAAVIKKHAAAKAYLAERGLDDPEAIMAGYKSRKTAEKWGRGCVVFPLRNDKNEVVRLYGRAIKGNGHYYTAGRRGLYPYYPDASTWTLVLTESVIDAASIKRPELGLDCYAILALYGTNGLTAAHRAVITGLAELQDIILTLDGDAAGREATKKIAAELARLRPGVRISYVPLAEGEDVNSVTVRLRAEGKEVAELFAVTEVLAVTPPAPSTTTAPASAPKNALAAKLDTTNPHNLVYRAATATYEVKGGIRTADKDLDSLKVTLAIRNNAGRRSRQKLDLYEDKQVSKTAREVADRLGLRADLIELDLDRLTELLEAHRETLRDGSRERSGGKVSVGAADRQRCLDFLKSQNLLAGINELIERAGIVGEETNRLLLFVVASSYAMPQRTS